MSRKSDRIRAKYPNHVPILIRTKPLCLDKAKYLVPRDYTVGQFVYVLRKRMQLDSEEAIFLYSDKGELPLCTLLIGQFADQNIDTNDGFLYFHVRSENTFG